MKEKDLPIDRSKHVVYTKNAKKCVQNLLYRCYDAQTAEALWEKIQLQYCDYLKEEPALGSAKITVSIYDPILIFAWFSVVPDMIIFQYCINRARTRKRKFSEWLKSAKEIYAEYTVTVKQLKERTKEKKALSAEKKATSALKITRHRELTQRIATLTEEIEELRSEKARLLDSLSCKDDSEISRFKKEVADTEQTVKRLSVQEEKYTAELEKAFAEYNELKTQAENLDPVELFYARESLRKECEEAAESRIRTASKDIDFWGMASARQTVDGKLDLYSEEQRVKKILWERKQNEREQPRHKKPMDRGYER